MGVCDFHLPYNAKRVCNGTCNKRCCTMTACRDDAIEEEHPKSMLTILLQWVQCALHASITAPGVEPGLSRPQRDVLTTRRCGPWQFALSGKYSRRNIEKMLKHQDTFERMFQINAGKRAPHR